MGVNLKSLVLGAGVAVAGFSSLVFAGANDYAFEPVKSEIKSTNEAIVAVRLIHKATRKPVTDAVIAQTRIDMAPDGMPTMDAPLVRQPSREPGVFAFKSPLTMAGRWLFSVSAKVPGEAETVNGTIIFRVTK